MNGRLKKNLGLWALPLACLFLFNPDIAVVDVLPDVFGYIILYFALEQYSEISTKIADARELFKKAIYVNAIKLLTVFVIFGMVIESEMPVTLLLFSFVMGILDLIFIIPGYIKLFGGILYTGERVDGEYILGRKLKKMIPVPEGAGKIRAELISFINARRQRKNRYILSRTEKLRSYTLIFLFVKVACAILPEASSLLNYRNSSAQVNYYDFVYLFRTVGIIIVLIVGAVWIAKMSIYFRGFTKNRPLMDKLEEQYREEILPNKAYHMKKRVFRTLIIASAAVIFSLDLYFDMYNITPDLIIGILMIATAIYSRKYLKEWKLLAAFSALLCAVSGYATYRQFYFFENYNAEKIYRDMDDYNAFMDMIKSNIAEGVMLVLFTAALMYILRRVILRTTGITNAQSSQYEQEMAQAVHRELTRHLISPVIFAAASAILNAVHVYSVAFPLSERFGAGCMINYGFCIAYGASVIHAVFEIYHNIEFSHLAEE